MALARSNRVAAMEHKVVETNSESVSEERGKKHVIFEVSGTASHENKVKVRKPFEIDKTR